MKSIFDACILTNGRSSYDLCLKSLQEQSVEIKIHTIRDMSMVDAMNHISNNKNISRYFLKVDDDFMFHPKAIEYLQCFVPFESSVVMRYWYLYDVATSSPIQSVKIYDRKLINKVGGFRPRSSGRVDPPFLEDSRKAGLRYIEDRSILALHACAPGKDQLMYEKIWARSAPSKRHIKNYRSAMFKCSIDMNMQYKKREEYISNNNNQKFTFSEFLKEQNEKS